MQHTSRRPPIDWFQAYFISIVVPLLLGKRGRGRRISVMTELRRRGGFLCWNSGWLVVLNKPLGGLILLIVVDGSPSSYKHWAKNGKKCNKILLISSAREVEFYCSSSSTYPEKNSSEVRGFLNRLGHSLGENEIAQNIKIYHKIWSISLRV